MIQCHSHTIDAQNITMAFPGVLALDHVNFHIRSGEIRALIGANGAGKSTLMNVLAGALPEYTGDVILDGEMVRLSSPVLSKQYGIALVSQEVDAGIFPNNTVAENIMFDTLVNKMGKKTFISWPLIRERAQRALQRLNQDIDINMPAGMLTLAQKQMVLIARAISQDCSFLILDEPTSALSTTETKRLFSVLRELISNVDMGVIFISHRLSELFEICDYITVMRNGKVVSDRPIGDLTIDEVVADMLGDTAKEPFVRVRSGLGDVLLEVRDLCDTDGKVNHVSFTARAGEVIGISGLVGSGKTELAKCIFGASRRGNGKILIRGCEQHISSPTQAVRLGMGLIPEERRKEGAMISHSVMENLSFVNLPSFTKLGFVCTRAEREYAERMIAVSV